MKQMKTVSTTHYYNDYPDIETIAWGVNSEKFISWLLSKYALLPVEHKFTSTMVIDHGRRWISATFDYNREETEEEYQARLALEKQGGDERKTKQLKRLRKLADKFGYTLTENTET